MAKPKTCAQSAKGGSRDVAPENPRATKSVPAGALGVPARVKHLVGRPPIYTRALAAEILRRISGGEYVRDICKDDGLPSEETVHTWVVTDHDGFFALYMRAMQAQQLSKVAECQQIADDSGLDVRVDDVTGKIVVDGETVRRAELRIKTRQWVAERVYQKVFGTKVQVEDVTPQRTDEQVAARIRELLSKPPAKP